MTRYLSHAVGAMVALTVVGLLLAGGVIEAHLQFGISSSTTTTTPTTALAAAEHATSTTTASK